MVENVVVIGGGPAGMTAAIYLGRALLKPKVYEGLMAGETPAGGQITLTTSIENFPGFPDGIMGYQLAQNMKKQAQKFEAEFITKTITKVDFSVRPFKLWAGDEEIEAKSVIIATGAHSRRLGAPGETKFWQKGIATCAVCDGALPIFRNQHVVIVGGGDTAMEDALYMTNFASKVSVLVRRDVLRASKILQDQVKNNPKIEIMRNTEVKEFLGDDKLEQIKIINNKTGEEKIIEAKGCFYAIGTIPNTEIFKGQIELDEKGYVITKPHSTATNIPGVFAAGDVADPVYKQAIVAAGHGAMAGIEAERWIRESE